ncbi:DUF4312 family protein [Anaerorhabdus sp.]|uniref:DUF4312 family protein n=1 Tax=Anaerorhabdus sp. TaxID=1872524 RepID=UPI002FC71E97
MESTQVLRNKKMEIKVTISGNDFNDTVGKLFQCMRKEVFQEIGKPIIQMDTEEVYFDDVQKTEKTEKFLFVFMPRTKTYFTITARINVIVKYIDLE